MKWPMVKLGDIAVKKGGSVNPEKFPNETFMLWSIPAYDNGAPEILAGSAIGSSKKILKENDVLISRIIPHIRRVLVVGKEDKYRQIGSGEWIQYRSEMFYPQFLKHYLSSDMFHRQFMDTVSGVGGSLLRARPSEVERIEVPFPPLTEQKRIAAILDKADAIRQKRQQAIALADDFLRSVFLDMFGDPVTNPKEWAVHPLKHGVANILAGWSANGENRSCNDDEIGVLKISAVTSGIFKPNENKIIDSSTIPSNKTLVFPKKGDLLFSRANTRELVGATCIVDADYGNIFLPDKLWVINTKENQLLPEYLHMLIQHPRFKDTLTSQATGTSGSMLNISKAKFENTLAPFPALDTQNKFRDVFWKVMAKKELLRKSECLLSKQFNALSQKAFSGQL